MEPKLNFAHVCEQVIVEKDSNNISIINLFNEFRTKGVPAIHPYFSVISSTYGPKGNHKQKISVVDPGGGSVAHVEGNFEFSGDGPNYFVARFMNTSFKKIGKYSIRIEIDGTILSEEADSISLRQI